MWVFNPVRDSDYPVCPVPEGKFCFWCKEIIKIDETGFVIPNVGLVIENYFYHYECFLRGIVGSVGHQMKRCSCYGGTFEDPPGMSARDAAQLAVMMWQQRQWAERRQTNVLDIIITE